VKNQLEWKNGKWVRNKMVFQRGQHTLQLKEEERLYILKLIKQRAKPKSALEKRIVTRLITRCMGYSVANIPLYPKRECSICHREFEGSIFQHHFAICKAKKEAAKRMPPVDYSVLEMLEP